MDRAITSWLTTTPLPPSLTSPLAAHLRKTRYTLLGPLLLLPPSALPPLPSPQPDLTPLLAHIAHHLKATHIALSTPIPSSSPHPLSSPSANEANTDDAPPAVASTEPNILRTPHLQPLYGDFGPATLLSPSLSSAHPSEADLSSALWIPTRQNSLLQVFAPRWTMFSRGNVAEKARILSLPSVAEAVQRGRRVGEGGDGRGCAAVDLYVGIGYFAFSYLRAGVRAVVGWEINGWSVEGLRRGAEGNGFGVRVVREEEEGEEEMGGEGGEGGIEGMVVFWEGNERAGERIRGLRGRLPPVRHVNCGLLPTSRGSWGTAVEVLDPEMGGWVHVHENFGTGEIEGRAEEVRVEFERIAAARGRRVTVEVEYVNRLKSYAPGVVHCVVDLHVVPIGGGD